MAEAGSVIACHSLEQWTLIVEEANKSNKLIVIDFTATWCPPCKMMAPIFVEHAKNFPHVFFVKVDVDEAQALAEQFGIQAMPTFLFIKEGKEIHKIQGADKAGLLSKITEHAGVASTTTSSTTTEGSATS